MSRIDSTGAVIPTTTPNPADGVKVEQPTGQGVTGDTGGPVPTAAAPSFGAILQSLRNFSPATTGGDFETRLAEIAAKMRDVSGEVETSRAENEQEMKRLNMQENQAKIEEAEEKIDEAISKRENASIWDKIAMAFQILGAILLFAIGAALTALGAGAVGVPLMIAAGFMAVSLINSAVAEANDGRGILASIAYAIDEDIDPDILMGLDIGFTALMVVASIVLAVATGGGSMSGVASNLAALAQGLKTAGMAVEIASSVGSAAATVGSAATSVDAAKTSQEAAYLQAESQEIQALMQQLDDLIDQALEMLQQAAERFNAVLDSMTEMLNDSGTSVSSTRFTG